ncbi:MAG: glycoside hydrolase family 127 protein [Phycisphaerae bacterium]|nr:glycoside hydrolase family 127 protein [Phycisphaerae bacterium]
MRIRDRIASLALVVAAAVGAVAPSARADDLARVPAEKVTLDDPFWAPRLDTNRRVTATHVLDECERTGRVANFLMAAKAMKEKAPQRGGMRGLFFNDSDVYKAIEGCARVLAANPDPALEARCDAIIDAIAAAQEPDGYLYTSRTILDTANMPPGGPSRWSDMGGGHELYCAGHLYEAAVAYANATGKTKLLDVATSNADLVARSFGPTASPYPCGHPEIEIGLATLYEKTRKPEYLATLRFFVDARGRQIGGRPLYGEYAQDHKPILEQDEAVGHAVRLAYLQSGVLDLARLAKDATYLAASERVWNDVVGRKMYVTGGIGSQGNNEGFGAPYALANGSAYNETCAAIAFVLWSERLFLATGDARYVDVLERTLHNAMLSGWSLSGDRFFYPNPLEVSSGRERAPWFDCACCPPNVVRFIASVPGLVFATGPRDLYVNLYVAGKGSMTVGDAAVAVTQKTGMPYDGAVAIDLDVRDARGTPSARPFALRLRIPGWARGEVAPGGLYRFVDPAPAPIAFLVNGSRVDATVANGYATIDRTWTTGDRVTFALPLDVQRVAAREEVAADRGRIALSRGPLVYCVEAKDIEESLSPLAAVTDLAAPWTPGAPVAALGNATTLVGSVRPAERQLDGSVTLGSALQASAIPYAFWANRGPTPMAVWLAVEPQAAKPAPAPTIARRAKASTSFGGDVQALNDQLEPSSSGDHEHPFLHWWPKKGTTETITYEFDEPTTVRSVEVYWFDDTGRGECRLPKSWTLEKKRDGAWSPIEDPSGFTVEGDRYNRCEFEQITVDALRLVVTSQDGWAGGIHEWRVNGNEEIDRIFNADAVVVAPDLNVIQNGDFAHAGPNGPELWSRSVWATNDRDGPTFDGDLPGRDGMGAGIRSSKGADAAWSQTVAVKPHSRYRLSGWVKATDVTPIGGAAGVLFNLHGLPVRTDAVTGTKDWTELAVDFDTNDNDAITVNCLFGGWGLATGSAMFDDVRLDLLKEGEAPAPSVTIDAAAVREPISKYVYGQFIEHLGRCIYGGIWAEMLEDRKFHDPVGNAESPWRTFGGATVAMDTTDPFVGVHTPVVTVGGEPGGLVQSGLAIETDERYVGHAWIKGDGPVTIALVDRDGTPLAAPTTAATEKNAFTKVDFTLQPVRASVNASLRIVGPARGTFRVGTASLMPASNVRGFRADTLALLKELDAPVYRWPGGNFVSGYDWRDGVGERDRRPPRKNPAWQGIEHNDVGLHEFLDLCDLLGTEPYIAVNTGLGSVENAVAELEYVNGAPTTPMGAKRAANGRVEPWKVRFWGIGNEMYGSWQLGNVPLGEYVKRHNAFVDALRAVDPSIHVIAVGAVGDWSRTMLRDCADRMDSMSEHVYWQDRPGVLAHVRQAPNSLRAIADAHRAYRRELPSLKGRDIRIVQDEWNYWYGPTPFGELGTRYFMKDALGCAAALHEFGRNSDLFFMANYAQTVNVIGAIKTSKTNAALESTGLVLKLYRRHFGTIPCATAVEGSIDALAAWNDDRTVLTVAFVNPSREAATVKFAIAGATLGAGGTRYEIAHPDPMAFNDPDGARPIVIAESAVPAPGDTVTLAPLSVTLYAFPAVPAAR